MAGKRGASSPPVPLHSSSSSSAEEVGSPRAVAPHSPPQNPQPYPPAAAEQSDPEAGALVEAPANPTAAATQVESSADEVPEPVPETALATKAKAKTKTKKAKAKAKKAKAKKAKAKAEGGASGQGPPRSFEEVQKLYPNLASWVERPDGRDPDGEDLKAALGAMDDEEASALEAEMKEQRRRVAETQVERMRIMEMVLDLFVGAMD